MKPRSLVAAFLVCSFAVFPADSGGAQASVEALLVALAPGADSDLEALRKLMAVATPEQIAARRDDGATPLHLAAQSPKTLHVLRWLVERKADIEAKTREGMTPFAEAAFRNNLDAMRYLAERGANERTIDHDNATPLHAAAYGPRPATLRWLVENRAEVHAKDKWGRTALDIALDSHRYAFRSDAERLEIVTLLGGTRADVARGTFYDHPLHLAVRALDIGAVRRLLEQGTDPNVKNEAADTPLRAALDYSSRLPTTPAQRAFGAKLLPLLIQHGARSDLYMGGAQMRTYDQHARELGIADLLERTQRRHAPRRK